MTASSAFKKNVIRQLEVVQSPPGAEAEILDRIDRVFRSRPMTAMAATLARSGLTVQSEPIVCKYLDARLLRLMFPVIGGEIEPGAVVAVVCLYDGALETTLYAHAMHAGPDVNPLLKHPDGPMAGPKSQSGEDGERATRRIIEHKRALWDRYIHERRVLGHEKAGRQWRAGYYWALKRLYYCTRCTPCRWGSPFYDGPDSAANAKPSLPSEDKGHAPSLNGHAELVGAVLTSDAWQLEVAYAARGGFRVREHPRLIKRLEHGIVQLVFATDVRLIQGGTLVALAVTYDTRRQRVLGAHCQPAGPEAEIQFLLGDVALGLPPPQPGAAAGRARAAYAHWRRKAWSQFWLDELECGIAVASANWLAGFWKALERLFGGNELAPCASATPSGDQWPTAACPHESGDNGARSVPVDSVLSIGGRCFLGHASANGSSALRAFDVSTLMVNLGRRCNLACRHCHVDAGPQRTEEMSRETVDIVLDVLRRHQIETLDITGGAPEMNPHFRYLVCQARALVSRIVDRCNLTILTEPGHEDLADFLACHAVEITASLPFYRPDNVDRQRGRGTFDRSIAALRQLNDVGYGKRRTGLTLNLVYNPIGTDLAPSQDELEQAYQHRLSEEFGITFNRLFAMNNLPIHRFRGELERSGRLPDYMARLVGAFNQKALAGLMCRKTVSVGWDGRLHDCDFNQALGIPLAEDSPGHIRDFDLAALRRRSINTRAHCFACAAGAGSSCNGALVPSRIRRNSRGDSRVDAGGA